MDTSRRRFFLWSPFRGQNMHGRFVLHMLASRNSNCYYSLFCSLCSGSSWWSHVFMNTSQISGVPFPPFSRFRFQALTKTGAKSSDSKHLPTLACHNIHHMTQRSISTMWHQSWQQKWWRHLKVAVLGCASQSLIRYRGAQMEGWCFEMSIGSLLGNLLRARRKSEAIVFLARHNRFSFATFATRRIMASNLYQVRSHKVAKPLYWKPQKQTRGTITEYDFRRCDASRHSQHHHIEYLTMSMSSRASSSPPSPLGGMHWLVISEPALDHTLLDIVIANPTRVDLVVGASVVPQYAASEGAREKEMHKCA